MKPDLEEIIVRYGRACIRDGNPAWESVEGKDLQDAIAKLEVAKLEVQPQELPRDWQFNEQIKRRVQLPPAQPCRAEQKGPQEWVCDCAEMKPSCKPNLEAKPTAKQRYDGLMMACDVPTPIEHLRLFCSLAMNDQDWLDVEPFFDAVEVAQLGNMKLPENAAELRDFLNSSYSSLRFGKDGGEPDDDDLYELTAHDLLSAFSEFSYEQGAQPVGVPAGWGDATNLARNVLDTGITLTPKGAASLAKAVIDADVFFFAAPALPVEQTENLVTLDRRDLFDFVRAEIKDSLTTDENSNQQAWLWEESTNRTINCLSKLYALPAAPAVELPVVAWLVGETIFSDKHEAYDSTENEDDVEGLVRLSDAQAAIAGSKHEPL